MLMFFIRLHAFSSSAVMCVCAFEQCALKRQILRAKAQLKAFTTPLIEWNKHKV